MQEGPGLDSAGSPGPQPRDSEAVALDFRRGRPEAVRVVRERVRRVVSYRGFGLSPADRQDLEQEAMAHLWQAAMRPDFDPAGGFWRFIDVVASRRCIDWRRKLRSDEEFDSQTADTGKGPLQKALGRERIELARAALSELGEPCAELIYLRVTLDRSFDEIAALLGKTSGALRVQFFRCIRRAQEKLERATPSGRRGKGA
jgi:RNA polymerase sigma-70 factor (ECF subfamily)